MAKHGFFIKLELSEDEKDKPDLKLHRAVLDRALLDCFHPILAIRNEAEEWLDLSNDAYVYSCERALLSSEMVYQVFMAMKQILVGDRARYKRLTKQSLY